MRRWSTAGARSAAIPSSAATSASGCCGSPPMPSACSPTCRTSTGPTRPSACRRPGSAAARAPRCSSTSSARRSGPLKIFTTRPGHALRMHLHGRWRRSIPWSTTLTTPAQRDAVAAYQAGRPPQERPGADRPRQGQVRGLHRRLCDQPGQRRPRSRSGSPTTC